MALKDMLDELKELNLSELEFDKVGTWPVAAKAILWLLAFLVLVIGGYYYDIADKRAELEQLRTKETQLKTEFEQKAFKAANLNAYRQQMAEMKETFGALVGQLPTDTEVPGLLEDITDKAVSNGLEISSIALQPEVTREFYVELPISIKVKGAYHDLGAFVSGIAGLPRIVTLHDFSITASKNDPSQLDMSILARTYRYKDVEGGL